MKIFEGLKIVVLFCCLTLIAISGYLTIVPTKVLAAHGCASCPGGTEVCCTAAVVFCSDNAGCVGRSATGEEVCNKSCRKVDELD